MSNGSRNHLETLSTLIFNEVYALFLLNDFQIVYLFINKCVFFSEFNKSVTAFCPSI